MGCLRRKQLSALRRALKRDGHDLPKSGFCVRLPKGRGEVCNFYQPSHHKLKVGPLHCYAIVGMSRR